MIYRQWSVFRNINVVYYTLPRRSRTGFYDSSLDRGKRSGTLRQDQNIGTPLADRGKHPGADKRAFFSLRVGDHAHGERAKLWDV